MRLLFRRHAYVLAATVLICVGVAQSTGIALQTRYDAHPDEIDHVNAFCYFGRRAWPPPLNSPEVFYSTHGMSRVFTQEAVYFVYGRIGAVTALLMPPTPTPPVSTTRDALCVANFRMYRLFNVALLAATLIILFLIGVRHKLAALVAVGLLCLPQVVYTYSYANSDAWALSFSIFLCLLALVVRRPLASMRSSLLLALLTAGVLLSKAPYWLAIGFAFGLIGYHLARDGPAALRRAARTVGVNALLAAAVTLLIAAPLLIWYPLSQGGNLAGQLEQIIEKRADPIYRPSDPTAPGWRLRSRGVGPGYVLGSADWYVRSAMSFYGLFGYLTESAPAVGYGLAAAVMAANVFVTARALLRGWPAAPDTVKAALIAAPALFALNVAASLYNSWTNDYQAQGRYLFPSLVPIILCACGTVPWERGPVRRIRLGSAILLLALCAFVIWRSVLTNPALR